jgi:diguanylate cyclase (GGDEF)-like protein
MSFLLRIFRGSIANERELSRYVVSVTAICVAVALAVDVANQLSFFIDWATCIRSWTITTVLVLALAIPISRTIGKAHLNLYRAKLRADELSRTDLLTGLANRRALMETIDGDQPDALALVIVDVDRFKRVNDSLGHLAGDEVLRSIGQMMATELGGLGLVARVGGEEFALLAASAPPDRVEERIRAFRDRVAATPVVACGHAVQVTISAGIAVRRAHESFDQLYSAADRALYAAKAAGRNRVLSADRLAALGERVASERERADRPPRSAGSSN